MRQLVMLLPAWLGTLIALPGQFPAELPFGSQAKVTEYIRGEINSVGVYLQWKTSQSFVFVCVERNGNEAYDRAIDGELEHHITQRMNSIWEKFIAGRMTEYPESLNEGETLRFWIACDTNYKYDSPTPWATYLRATTSEFILRKVNGQWVAPETAFDFTLPFDNTWNVFYMPGVKWVEKLKRNNYLGFEEVSLTRNGVIDTDGCPYGSLADLYGNGMIYIGSVWINGTDLDIPGVWGKITFWTDEDRTESVIYNLATGKMVVPRTTIKPSGFGDLLEITLHDAEPGKEYTLCESALIERLSSDDGTPTQIGVADENWQVQFVIQSDPWLSSKFFLVRPTQVHDRQLLSVGKTDN